MHHMHFMINHSVEMAAEGSNLVMIGEMDMAKGVDALSISHGRTMIKERPPVDFGQQVFPVLEAALDLPVVDIAFHLAVGIEPISASCASGFDRRSDKAMKRCAVEIGDSCHANAPERVSESHNLREKGK